MALKSYHFAWLSLRPHRSEQWLSEKLAEGFDVHHVDGDHTNDDPSNLVLIEHVDHMRLHNMKGVLGRLSEHRRERARARNAELGVKAKAMFEAGVSIREVSRTLGRCPADCIRFAKLAP